MPLSRNSGPFFNDKSTYCNDSKHILEKKTPVNPVLDSRIYYLMKKDTIYIPSKKFLKFVSHLLSFIY